ncbi:MAG: glycoside hydrolase family 47 protein [Phycisphaerales bacterium]|nr:glycoside hydrolase family 47 protein [Phycisphaerales bacterium]
MKHLSLSILILLCLPTFSRLEVAGDGPTSAQTPALKRLENDPKLAAEVRAEMRRCWRDYKTYAWGHDVLLPISRRGHNWYDHSLGISPFDAYSTLVVMGFDEEAREIEQYALSMDWDKDVYVQVFEVNIRILGGLLSMYHYSGNPAILDKARDFADHLLPAFKTPTGIPTHSVNLRTGKTAGDRGQGTGEVVNVAQAATYLFEFGILSYYTSDAKYYQAAKRATLAIFNRRSKIGLIGDRINVQTGEWAGRWSHLQAGVDAYYEYLYKSWMLFPDPEIKAAWDQSIAKIDQYLADSRGDKVYYTIVDMDSGEVQKRSVTLYDAFFPAVQAISGHVEAAEKNQRTWHWLWMKYGMLPTQYRYDTGDLEWGHYDLNPEIIESGYYLHQITGKPEYLEMIRTYWADLKKYCRDDVGFHSIDDVRTKKPKDYMPTFFFAETLKYLYIAFAGKDTFDFQAHVFNTEAHTFRRDRFDPAESRKRLRY